MTNEIESKGDITMEDLREPLADYFQSQARWREMKAEEYPDDERRNLAAAEALEEMADYVLTLTPHDDRLALIGASRNWAIKSGMSFGGREGGWVASHIGFDCRQVNLDRELSYFALACANDAEGSGILDDYEEENRRELARLQKVVETAYYKDWRPESIETDR
jgi:hypothetical protein